MSYFPAVIWGMLFSVSLLILILNLGFQVNLEFEKSGDDLQMHFPITIATVPFRIPNSNQQPSIHYGNVRNKDLSFSMWNGMSQNTVWVSVCGYWRSITELPWELQISCERGCLMKKEFNDYWSCVKVLTCLCNFKYTNKNLLLL